MKAEKKLIVNADDFGLHRTVNEAVEAGCRQGILTSASIMTVGEAFEDALAVIKRNPGLGVGLHLTLNGQRPVATAGSVGSLLDEKGLLMESHGRLFRRLVEGKVSSRHIALECEAQIRKALDAGIALTHIDSHRHVHLFPLILSALKPVLERYRIGKMRRLSFSSTAISLSGLTKLGFIALSRFGNRWSRSIASPDRFIGFFQSGNMDAAYVRGAVASIGTGVSELALHPAINNEALKERYEFWIKRYNWPCRWQEEFAAIIDPVAKEALRQRDVRLISYASL